MQVSQALERIGSLQQRSVAVVANAPIKLLRRRLQVDGLGTLAQVPAVLRPQDSAPPRGQDRRLRARQLLDHFGLDISKALLALALEELPDRPANPRFDDCVRVLEVDLQPSGQLPTDGRLA